MNTESNIRETRTILTEVPGCRPHRASDTTPLQGSAHNYACADIIACRYCGRVVKDRLGAAGGFVPLKFTGKEVRHDL